jgi:hypothetical protein
MWSATNTCICIELACGSLYERLRSTHFLQPRPVSAAADTFAADETSLKLGMGPAFYSLRNDGTVKFGSTVASNAFQRLQYVCAALVLAEAGSFPHTFTPPSSCLDDDGAEQDASSDVVPDVPADQCFKLLCWASGLLENPSLWCIWNFVNVVCHL